MNIDTKSLIKPLETGIVFRNFFIYRSEIMMISDRGMLQYYSNDILLFNLAHNLVPAALVWDLNS